MATTKPRITITLTEVQHRLLNRLSELQGVSMSSIVVDFLDSVVPVLERVAVVLQQAKDAPESVKKQIRDTAEQAERDMVPFASEMMGQLDMLVGLAGVGVGGQPEAAPAPTPAKKPASKRGQPPSTNRGVRNPQPKPLKVSRGAASKGVLGSKKK